MSNFPTQADIVVIGGGIIGCSTAYHLAKEHKANVVLLEQGQLTSGTTWHAAGLVGQLRSSASITRVLKKSVEIYKNLAAETGLETGWKMSGCLRLATNDNRWTEFKRTATTAKSFGMDMHLLSPAEAKAMFPLMDVDDLVGATFLPTDGEASPSDITMSLAKGARMHGATLIENVRVISFDMADNPKGGRRITGVQTTLGKITCNKVVNCGGQWARQIGAMAGISVPLQPVKHQYVVTEKIEGLSPDATTIRDPDRLTYFKHEVGGLVFGGYEPNPQAWLPDTVNHDVPDEWAFRLFDDDYDHFEQHMIEALARIPALADIGIKQMINGPESFTPDGNFILGVAPECSNMFVGAGFNAYGIAAGGGAGWALATWVVESEAPLDLWAVDIRRFSNLHRSRDWVRERTLEAYGKHYTIAFPHEEYTSGRPAMISPLYDRLKSQGAVFGSKLGWERPNWFAPDGTAPVDHYSMGRQNWFEPVGNEHQHVRNHVGIFDQSSFAKFEMTGLGACAALEWICANRIDKPVGKLTYTQLLNTRGGIEADLTVARLAENKFYIVTGTGFRTHDFGWIRDHIPAGLDATLTDVTEQFGTLSLMGPKARNVLSKVTNADVSNAAFPFGGAHIIEIAGAKVCALRVTYVGELGWELHVPIDALGAVYEALIAAGADDKIRPIGYRALESLRLEKGYRAWGSDITPNDTPYEAGLGWAVKLKSNVAFMGREALTAKHRQPLTKQLCSFTVEDPAVVLLGRETILRNGVAVGYLSSGGYGYTTKQNIGLGYVKNESGVSDEYLASGVYELVVAMETVPARLHMGALVDPAGLNVKA